jgi:acetyl esterase
MPSGNDFFYQLNEYFFILKLYIMDNETFKAKLLPELRFIADIPSVLYEDEETIRNLRKLRFPAPALPFEDRVTHEDREIRSFDGATIRLRIYRPAGIPDAALVVWFHGGGFMVGDLDTEHVNCMNISAGADAVVVSVDYRLAPENPYPTGIEDCYAGLQWGFAHAKELNARPERLIIGGTSSGASLAASVALMARDRNFNHISQQILIVPPTDMFADNASMSAFNNITGGLNAQNVKLMWKHYLKGNTENIPPYASPLSAVSLRNLPPAYIVTVELDPLRDEGQAYATRLTGSGVQVQHRYYPGTPHFFTVAYETDTYRKFSGDMITAIRKQATDTVINKHHHEANHR